MHGEDRPVPSWATMVRAPNPGPMTLDGTNTWVLRAGPGEPVVVVGPGPADEAHPHAVAGHGPVAAVLVTHGHPDHVDGLGRFLTLTGVRVRRLPAGTPTELAGRRITAIDSPGHTADSVCFRVETGKRAETGERAVLTGDTILGHGTTMHYLEHRRERLDQVRRAVAAGAETPAAVVERVYADVDPVLWPAAEWSVRAQLAYLRFDIAVGVGWWWGGTRRAEPPESRESAIGVAPLDSL